MLAAYSFLRSILTLSGHAPGAAADEGRDQQILVGDGSDHFAAILHVFFGSVRCGCFGASSRWRIWVVVDRHQGVNDDVSLGDGGTGCLLSLPARKASSLAAIWLVAETILDRSLHEFACTFWISHHVTDSPSLWAGAASFWMFNSVSKWHVLSSLLLTLNICGRAAMHLHPCFFAAASSSCTSLCIRTKPCRIRT